MSTFRQLHATVSVIIILALVFTACSSGSGTAPARATIRPASTPAVSPNAPDAQPAGTAEGSLPNLAQPAPPTSTIDPDGNLDLGSAAIIFATQCVQPGDPSRLAFMLTARRVTYVWTNSRLGSDPLPSGETDYPVKLVLDDARPDLRRFGDDAAKAHEYSLQTDRYFRRLAAKGAGVWDGCYGKSEIPIMTSIVHYRHRPERGEEPGAYWQGQTSYAGVVFSENFVTQDIVAHEWTHGLVDRVLCMETEGGPDGQTGALAESLSDVFAVLQRGDGTYSVNYSAGAAGRAARHLDQPEIDHWDKFVKNGDKYLNAGIPNKAAYLIIEALGKERAELIYFHALNPEFMRSAACHGMVDPCCPRHYSFEEFAHGVVEACSDLVSGSKRIGGITISDCNEVATAFRTVGMLPKSSEAVLGPVPQSWTGTFDQFNHSRYPMVLYVEKVDGDQLFGRFSWPTLRDSVTSMEGRIVQDFGDASERERWRHVQTIVSPTTDDGLWLVLTEPQLLQGSNIVLNGLYYAYVSEGIMQGVWFQRNSNRPEGQFMITLDP